MKTTFHNTRLARFSLVSTATETAYLFLLTGSRAGMVAPIHEGYYLIGRDRECQIRPKTRSVSRTHCLIHFGVEPPLSPQEIVSASRGISPGAGLANRPTASRRRFFVLDLMSTSGTKVNGEKTPPRQWIEMQTDSELRCGKIAWNLVLPQAPIRDGVPPVAIADRVEGGGVSEPHVSPKRGSTKISEGIANNLPPAESKPSAKPQPAVPDPEVASSIIRGGAWQESDVAAFLAAHDDADRENRYEAIRTNVKRTTVEDGGTESDGNHAFAEDDSYFEKCDSSKEVLPRRPEVGSEETESSKSPLRSTGPPLTSQDLAKKAARDSAEAKRKSKRDRKRKAEQKRSARAAAGASPLIEKLKVATAVALTAVTLGLAAYQIVQLRSGPPAQVVNGID